MAYPAQLAGSGAAVLSTGIAGIHLAGKAATHRRSAVIALSVVSSASPAVPRHPAVAVAEANGSVAL